MDAMTDIVRLHDHPHARSDGSVAATPAEASLAVSAIYGLSELGRKLSLLSGGNGRAVQQLTVHVPSNRLHLVSVDADGVARLRLRPHYEYDTQQQVVRIDAPPTYDTPPDLETLFQHAARNHQLERAYETQRRASRAVRRDTERERRAQLARAFLEHPERRAVVHPTPTPRRCHLSVNGGLVRFDVRQDEGLARDVPQEAHRRFRADLRARAESGKQLHAQQMALHDEKKRFVAEWVASHGSPDQQARLAVGLLPMEEAIEAITDEVFAPIREWPRYERGGVGQYRTYLLGFAEYADVAVTERDVVISSTDATKASAEDWAQMQKVSALLPAVTVTLRVHRLGCSRDRRMPSLTLHGLLVTLKVGPLLLRREYIVESH